MNKINAAAESSREQARRKDGRFGVQQHAKADSIELTATDDREARIDRMLAVVDAYGPYPTMTAEQQEAAGGQEFFVDAYIDRFDKAQQLTEECGGDRLKVMEVCDQRLEKACRNVEAAFGIENMTDRGGRPYGNEPDGWYRDLNSRSQISRWEKTGDDGGWRSVDQRTAATVEQREALREIDRAHELRDRCTELAMIEDGELAPWYFLPMSDLQRGPASVQRYVSWEEAKDAMWCQGYPGGGKPRRPRPGGMTEVPRPQAP